MFFQRLKGIIIKNEIDNRILSDYCATAWRRDFSGLDLGNKLIKTEAMLLDSYVSKIECEDNLVRLKGKNKISEVDSFYLKSAKIVTDKRPLSDNHRVIVNAFQCLQIK